jgi:uncharacterized protein YwgA
MDKQQIGVKLVMDHLDFDFGKPLKMDSFEGRLILQKAIYLIQEAGVDLGYYFSWYLRGPYCSALASDGFAIQHEIESGVDDSQSWKLGPDSCSKLNSVRALVQPLPKSEEDKARQLELLASVKFLIDRKNISKDDIDELTSTLKKYGKRFERSEVKKAVGDLKQHGFVK